MNRQQRRAEAKIGLTAKPAALQGTRHAQSSLAENNNTRGIELARQGKLNEAVAAFRQALAALPGCAQAHNNLGIVFAQQSLLAEATNCFRQALAHQPTMAEAQNNLGKALALQEQPDEAIACFRRAVALKPGYAEAYNNLGIELTQQGRLDEAVAAYTEAVRLLPNYADARNNLGIAHRYAGNLPAAIAACETALRHAPSGAAYLNLANLKPLAGTDPHIAEMERLAAPGSGIPAASRIAVHFALAKAYDGCDQAERAFPHLLAGNALKRASIAYDEADALHVLQHTQHIFSSSLMQALQGHGDPSAAPIFILGMPRSGSTLVEQMLSAHPQVSAGGERSAFSRLARAALAPSTYPHGAAGLTAQHLNALATNYLNALPASARGDRITDKMPGNSLYAGLIHLALPNARIIHTRRDPRDTCLSCFSTLFGTGHAYSFNLAELGRYHRAHDRLMAHWRNVIPPSALVEIDYETLVTSPATEITRILRHCGLDWNEACLTTGNTQRPVLTASATQVRQPVNTHSVGRWRRYGAFLEPLMRELEQ